jgi:hypothetical protein
MPPTTPKPEPESGADPVLVWQTLECQVVDSNSRFDLRRDLVVNPDGAEETYSHVIVPATVTVLAVDSADSVLLTRHWCYPHGGSEWRLPGGPVGRSDADPAAAARRVLAAQTGRRSTKWRPLGLIHGADSVTNHVDHLFLATVSGPRRTDSDRLRRVPFADTLALVRAGRLRHAGSAHALLRAALDRAGIG